MSTPSFPSELKSHLYILFYLISLPQTNVIIIVLYSVLMSGGTNPSSFLLLKCSLDIFTHLFFQMSYWIMLPDVLRSQSWCIELRICQLWPAEWGGTSHTPRVGRWLPQHLSSHFWEGELRGSFWLKAQFQYTCTKDRGGTVGVGRRTVLCPRSWSSRKQRTM